VGVCMMPFVFIPTFRLKGSRGSSSKRSQHTSRISVISDTKLCRRWLRPLGSFPGDVTSRTHRSLMVM